MRHDLSPASSILRIAMNMGRVNDGEVNMSKGRGGGSYRSAISGRYVTAKHGKASPRTTVRESAGSSGGSGGRYRSAISGRYVTTAHGKASPRTTLKES
jgi:hypothetical protein